MDAILNRTRTADRACNAMKSLALLPALLAVALIGAKPVEATEGGLDNGANGNSDLLAGPAVPPGPGQFELVVPVVWNHLGKFRDGDGVVRTPDDFGVDAELTAISLTYAWPIKPLDFLGGARVGSNGVVPFLNLKGRNIGTSRDNATGFGDISLSPVVLTWHFNRVYLTATADFVVPTGAYDVTRGVNPGGNYFTARPAVAFSYLGSNGLEFSMRTTFDFNVRNPTTNYKSGRAFATNYNLSYRWGGRWQAGVFGYGFYQVSDDEVDGVRVGNDGFRGRAFSVGPFIHRTFDQVDVIVKLQNEVYARNRLQGRQLIVDLFWPL